MSSLHPKHGVDMMKHTSLASEMPSMPATGSWLKSRLSTPRKSLPAQVASSITESVRVLLTTTPIAKHVLEQRLRVLA